MPASNFLRRAAAELSQGDKYTPLNAASYDAPLPAFLPPVKGEVSAQQTEGQGIRLMKNPSEIPFFAVMPPESPVPETGLSFLVSGL